MKVVLLTNFIPPHRIAFYQALNNLLEEFTILISTNMEANRNWPIFWGKLNVVKQKTITLHETWVHPKGFTDKIFIHIPIDTLKQLKKIKPDWIISGELGMRTIQAIIYCYLHSDTKLAIWATISESTEQGRGKLREYLRKWIIPHADIIFVNGKSGERYIKKIMATPNAIIHIPRSIDNAKYEGTSIIQKTKKVFRFLSIGQLISRKGLIEFQSVFINWANKHPDVNFELWYVGVGILKEKLQQMPTPDNVEIKFLGYVEYAYLPEIYNQGDILLYPTLADEWGVVINEAMASGLPVLGSIYSQAVEELIEEGETGWLFRPDHPEEIDAALERTILLSDEQMAAMGIKAKERIAKVTPQIAAQKMVNAIVRWEQKI